MKIIAVGPTIAVAAQSQSSTAYVKQMSLLGAEKIERGDHAGNQSTA
jgi:hypothetical protein